MRERLLGRRPGSALPAAAGHPLPDWQQSDPGWIRRAVERAGRLPSGGWYVIDAVRAVGEVPCRYRVANRELVVWRGRSGLLVAPNACPHLGASLADGHLRDGCLVCPWHGLVLGAAGHGGWRPLPSHDDGVLLWVRIAAAGEPPSQLPYRCTRPRTGIDAVIRMEARCAPQDIIANRFDPWHGVHFHPHSFGALTMLEQGDDAITVRVVYRATRRMGVEVDARVSLPGPAHHRDDHRRRRGRRIGGGDARHAGTARRLRNRGGDRGYLGAPRIPARDARRRPAPAPDAGLRAPPVDRGRRLRRTALRAAHRVALTEARHAARGARRQCVW